MEIRDATGTPIPWRLSSAINDYPASAELSLPEGIRRLHFLHRTAWEGDLSAAPVVKATLTGLQGDQGEIVFRYAKELAAEGEHLLLMSTDDSVWLASADDSGTLYAFTWEIPECLQFNALRLELVGDGANLGYELLALTAE